MTERNNDHIAFQFDQYLRVLAEEPDARKGTPTLHVYEWIAEHPSVQQFLLAPANARLFMKLDMGRNVFWLNPADPTNTRFWNVSAALEAFFDPNQARQMKAITDASITSTGQPPTDQEYRYYQLHCSETAALAQRESFFPREAFHQCLAALK